MARADLLSDITNIVEGYGFLQSNDQTPFTYQRSVRYPSLIDEKNDTAHFVLHTTTERIQITAKWQEVGGTAIEKLGYTVLDAGRTAYD
ncbi:PD-(D/E)XK nuclease superfamily protein [Vibrio metschnikovii]